MRRTIKKRLIKAAVLGLGMAAACSLYGCGSAETAADETDMGNGGSGNTAVGNSDGSSEDTSENPDSKSLLSASYTVHVNASEEDDSGRISDTLYGLFFGRYQLCG